MTNRTYEVEVTTNSLMNLSSFRINKMSGAGVNRKFLKFPSISASYLFYCERRTESHSVIYEVSDFFMHLIIAPIDDGGIPVCRLCDDVWSPAE